MKENLRIVFSLLILGLLLVGLVAYLTRGGERPAPEPARREARPAPAEVPAQDRTKTSAAPARLSERPAAEVAAPGEEAAEGPATGPGTITGLVVDEAGRPVSGAAVEVTRHDWRDPRPNWMEPVLRATISDDKGLFDFRDLSVQYRYGYAVQATTADAFGQTLAYLRDAWQSVEAMIVLKPSWRLDGTVADEAGRGVEGALVHVVEKEGSMNMGSSPMNLGARCGADGAFFLRHLPRGRWRFLVEAEGYPHLLTDYIAHDVGNVTFVLRAGGSLHGRAIAADSREAVPDLTIVAVASDASADSLRTTTGADGAFVFPALRPTEYELGLQHERLVLTARNVKVRVRQGAEDTPVILEVAEGGTAEGRVIDAETGIGIGGVDVSAQLQISTATGLPGQVVEGKSGADGAYHLAGLRVGQYMLWRANTPGYRPMSWPEAPRISVEAGRHFESIDFELRRGCTISGIVKDLEGAPVPGVQVRVMRRTSGESATAQSDAGGLFTVADFASGPDAVVTAKKGDMASPEEGPLMVPPEGLDGLVLTLSEALTASMSGILVDHANRPLVDYVVQPYSSGGRYGAAPTDGAGHFTVIQLAAGSYHVEVRPPNTYTTVRVSGGEAIELKAGEAHTGVRLVLDNRDEAAISGRVTNKQGQPIEKAHINVSGPMYAVATTDREGKYRAGGLSTGEYHVSAYHSDYSNANYDGQVSPGARDVNFMLEATGAIEGYVVDRATREPVTQYQIAYFQGKHERVQDWMYGRFVQISDAEGRFVLSDVSAGEATVIVRAAGYASACHAAGAVRAGETLSGVRIELEGGGALDGIVLDAEGVPLAEVKIFLGRLPDQWARNQGAVASTGADGTFHIDTLSRDDRLVSAYLPGYAPGSANFQTRPGHTVEVEIRLNAGGEIRGTVAVAGQPAPRARVRANKVDITGRGDSAETPTDSSGSYRLTGLADGEFMITARMEDPNIPGRFRSMERPAAVEGDWVTEVNFDFVEADSAVEGRITVDGRPAPDAHVSAQIHLPNGEEQFSAAIDADGVYRIEPIPAGHVRLSVSAADRERVVEFEAPAGSIVQQDVAFAGEAIISGAVAGLISGANNSVALLNGEVPIPDNPTPLLVMQLERIVVKFVPIDENGLYRGENIEPGLYTVVAYSIPDAMLGFRFQAVVAELKANEETVLDFDINPR